MGDGLPVEGSAAGPRTMSDAASSAARAGPIRVALADDQDLLRRSLALIIEAEPGMTVVGQAEDGAAACDLVRATQPDVLLLDLRMPRLSGIQTIHRLRADERLARTRILVLSMFELEDYVEQVLRAGAEGFLLKDTPPEALLEAIRRVHAGERLFAPTILARLIDGYLAAPRQGSPAALRELTPRELDVLGLVAGGLANREIAQRLAISEKTVKTHVSHLLEKLDARDRAQLVIAAYEAGLVRARGVSS